MPFSRDLPNPGNEYMPPGSPALQTDSFLLEPWGSSPILLPSFIFTLSQVHPLCFLHLFISTSDPFSPTSRGCICLMFEGCSAQFPERKTELFDHKWRFSKFDFLTTHPLLVLVINSSCIV